MKAEMEKLINEQYAAQKPKKKKKAKRKRGPRMSGGVHTEL